MRLLVCGSRTYSDQEFMFATLDAFHRNTPVDLIIEGEAPGADTIARLWAESRGIPFQKFPADWKQFGRAAGPKRNKLMLDEGKPDFVIGFLDKLLSESRGTANMLKQTHTARINYLYYFPGGSEGVNWF